MGKFDPREMKPYATTRNEDEIETTSEADSSDTVKERFSHHEEDSEHFFAETD